MSVAYPCCPFLCGSISPYNPEWRSHGTAIRPKALGRPPIPDWRHMAEDKKYVSGGTSFLTLLSVLFIGLKLAGYIDWPWLWVLAPIWGQFVLLLVILVVIGGAVLVLALIDRLK